jgi:hypothetical protein
MLNLKDLHREGVVITRITIILGLSLMFYSNPSFAGVSEFKEKLRPYITKYLGEEIAAKFLGAEKGTIELPEIPKINNSATDSSVYSQTEDDKIKNIPKEKRGPLDYAFIDELYLATRGTKGNKDQVGRWYSILAQGGTREGVYRALVLDNTYRGLENFKNPVSEKVVGFASYFFPRFLNKSIKKKALEGINFYTLKRISTESSLSVIDAYIQKDPSKLYEWYAVFSGELATKYPEVFKTKLRKIEKMSAHKKWASKVPNQYIKAEVMIKIHKIYNHLKN